MLCLTDVGVYTNRMISSEIRPNRTRLNHRNAFLRIGSQDHFRTYSKHLSERFLSDSHWLNEMREKVVFYQTKVVVSEFRAKQSIDYFKLQKKGVQMNAFNLFW
jgi:hypothetical protein